ncbi:hypothetical protein [Sandaracinus amylolyticus]|uniref:hypothetical protein n=1 Tax=Sandaracinus amylolyticus TaxID=927083 RepID=UPI001F1806F7|nr:hypothetical protein [Sandaracinus amylolyticus]UJR84200.1 Hypothetical protein I5071_62710 [Sandaracinus amylolyticus]
MTIDFQPYSRPPRIDALRGIALAIQLLRVAPARPSRPVARALRKVRSTAVDLQTEVKARGRTRPESLRPLDSAFDGSWSALRDRLAAWSKVQSASFERPRERAEQLLAAYFSDGVQFVTLAYEAEWVYGEQLLERFDEEGALADIERLAGAEFVANVREQQAALGAALGLTGKRGTEEVASTSGLAERVSALASAIADYTRRLSGEVETDDPKSVAAFRKAVAPLDAHRAATAPKASGGETPSEPAEPVDPSQPIPPAPEEE